MGKTYIGNNTAHETKKIYIGTDSGIAKQVQKAYIGTRNLPLEYTQLEYIENNNSEYIDTGIIITPTIRIEADFQIIEKKYGVEAFVFGNFVNDICRVRAGINSSNAFDFIGTIMYSQTSDIFARTNVIAFPTSGSSPTTTLLIFKNKRADTRIEGIGRIRLYSLKIYNSNTLIRNYIPCYRNSDFENGLYDTVNNVFYTNTNTVSTEYQPVEYIESTGTQYINTENSISTNIGTYITFNINNPIGSEDAGSVFGSDNNSGSRYKLETWVAEDSERQGSFWLGPSWQNVDPKIIPDEKLTIVHSTITNTVALNDNTYVSSTTPPTQSIDLYLFGSNTENEFASGSRMKLYQCKITNGYLIKHDYIPVIRKLDNKPGLYDLIDNQFLVNSGEDEFLYGDPIKDFKRGNTLPFAIAHLIYPHYQKVEYIQSSGTQWIDTGVIPNQNTRIQMKFRPLAAIGGVIIGYNNGNDSTDYRFFNASSGNYFDIWNKRINGGTCSANNDYTYELGNHYVKNLLTNTNIISGTAVSSFTGTDSIKLNASNSTSGFVNVRWYYVKIYDGITLIRDLYPCYRTSDNAVGMFDAVEKKFYNNNGTGVYTKGSDL